MSGTRSELGMVIDAVCACLNAGAMELADAGEPERVALSERPALDGHRPVTTPDWAAHLTYMGLECIAMSEGRRLAGLGGDES